MRRTAPTRQSRKWWQGLADQILVLAPVSLDLKAGRKCGERHTPEENIPFDKRMLKVSPVPPAIDKPQAQTVDVRLMALLHAGFVLTGVVNTMLGPLLPVLSARWALNDAHAGYLFTAQFSGSMLGVMGSSFLMSRRGHRISVVLGLGLMALGSATLLATSWSLGMLSTLCLGIGLGFAIPTTNLLVSELNPEKRAAALNLINFSWGVGAASCPFFVAALLRMDRTSHLLYGVAAALILVAVGMTSVAFPALCPARDTVFRCQPGWTGVFLGFSHRNCHPLSQVRPDGAPDCWLDVRVGRLGRRNPSVAGRVHLHQARWLEIRIIGPPVWLYRHVDSECAAFPTGLLRTRAR